MRLQFEYFYGNEAEDFTFYRIPKKIITSPHFKNVSYGAKMLYGLLFDRVGLSIMNSWFDEENRAYIIFSIQEIMDLMYCSKPTAIKHMSELEDAGLVERKKRGRGLTDYIYVKKVVDTEKVVKKVDHKELKDFTSDGQETELQEVKDFNPNNTNINNNYFNDTNTIPPPKSREDYEEIIKENIEYDILKIDFKGEWLDNIVELMLDVLCSNSKTVRVNQTNMPIEQVRKRYLSITDMHIRYLDDFVRKNNYEIHNFRNFYISAIYNAPIMIDSFYEEWVKEDMKRGAI